MFPSGPGAGHGIPRLAAIAIACALLGAAAPPRASAARDGRLDGALAAASSLAGAHRYAAAESVLRTLPPPPPDTAAALDRDETARERVWLRVRGYAPGACDSTWRWRPARLVAALERRRERPSALAGAWIDRSRVEYRQGLWNEAVASARTALGLLDGARERAALPRYRAHLALAEALAPQDQVRATPHLRLADSLARVLGDAAAAERPRHLRIAGAVAIMEGDMPAAVRLMSECVAASDAQVPPNDAEAGLGLVFQGFAEGFSDPVLGERHRAQARERLESTLGFGDERTLQVIGRSISNLRDPAMIPVMAALFDRVRDHLRTHGLEDIAGAWDIDYFQSRVKIALARYDEAHELLRHAIAISRRWHGPDNLREMTTNIDIGIVYWFQKDTTASIRHHRRALEIGAKFPVSLTNDPNLPRNHLATAYTAGGRLAEAREEYRAQWESYRDRYGETFRLASNPAARAARCSRGLGDTTQAELWYQRALLPFASGENGSIDEAGDVRFSYALFLYWRGDHQRAYDLALDGTRLRRRIVEETVPWLAEGDGWRYATQRRLEPALLMTLAALPPDAPEAVRAGAWTEMALGRGVLLEALLRRVKRPGGAESAAGGAGDLRRELAAMVLASLGAPDSPASRQRLDSLRAEIVRREMEPGAGGQAGGALPTLAVGEISSRLGDGVLVSYLRTQLFEKSGALGDAVWPGIDHYLAFVLAAGDTSPRVRVLGRADSIDAAVGAWRAAALSSPPARDEFGRGERLRRLVWDPLRALLPASGQVWFVPDGELQKVNFYALPVAPGRYLVDEPFVLHRIGSERDLLPEPEATVPAGGMLVMGGIDYERAQHATGAAAAVAPLAALPSCRAFVDERFEPLPATAGEAAAITALGRTLPGAARVANLAPLALAGLAADEASFKRLAPGRRIIHLATHSFFLGAECATGTAAANVMAENPLVFSGIALAGANRWKEARDRREAEDGLLTAEELAGLDLRGTEWLVLSGCESGLGQVKSWEGVFGLPRAGRRAGVRTLVMSLAPVDDELGSMWMRSLYEARFTRGEETALAVRDASRRVLGWLRRHGRPTEPRLWGAFVALGD